MSKKPLYGREESVVLAQFRDSLDTLTKDTIFRLIDLKMPSDKIQAMLLGELGAYLGFLACPLPTITKEALVKVLNRCIMNYDTFAEGSGHIGQC
jgi:hypothetical protein